MIGKTDQANHQYDINDFWNAAQAGNMPAVSFLKASKYQDGHASYSNPIDEQTFLVNTINNIQKLPQWNSTAIIIAYDDSDGWYDHVMPPIVSQSSDPKNDKLFLVKMVFVDNFKRCISRSLWIRATRSIINNISIFKSKFCGSQYN